MTPPISWTRSLAIREATTRPIRVLLLGQPGVGKTALAVRFATRRFIGEYDCTTERIYKVVDNTTGSWEIADPPGYPPAPTEPKLRWADAILIVYSVTDRVSFDETSRLRFLVSHSRRGHRMPSPVVALIGNKADLSGSPGERMVSTWEGRRRANDIGAHGFYEISTRESVDQVAVVFSDVARLVGEAAGGTLQTNSFRLRASTDGSIHELRRPPPPPPRRRLSISARGAPP